MIGVATSATSQAAQLTLGGLGTAPSTCSGCMIVTVAAYPATTSAGSHLTNAPRAASNCSFKGLLGAAASAPARASPTPIRHALIFTDLLVETPTTDRCAS